MTSKKDIVTVFDPTPDMPPRFNWRAYHAADHLDDPLHCGWGKTKREALADLKRLDVERAEWETYENCRANGGNCQCPKGHCDVADMEEADHHRYVAEMKP